MESAKVGQAREADPAKVAEHGYAALLADQTVSGLMNDVQVMFAEILPVRSNR